MREGSARELRLQQIETRLGQVARQRRIGCRALGPLEQRIERGEREREHARQAETGDETAAQKRQQPGG